MNTLFDNDCRYMSDSELIYEISNNRQIVSDIERSNEVIDLEKLFSSLTPGRRRVAVAAVEMYKRQLSQQVERRQIRMSKDVYELMEPLIGDLPNEEFWVVSINQAGRIIKKVRISVGGIDQTSADIRLIMRVLIDTGALHSVPVLGVNLGSLGFMSELEVDELYRLRDLADWSFDVESRMMLDVSVLRGGKSVYNNIALNDAVISKGSIARVVRLNIFTEEGQLTKVGGDGIIASTPTGSTGYSMAAGGPIVEPTARNLLLTPICPHSTRSSSYVLSPEHVITVEAPDANRKFVYLSVDGGKAFSLKNNDQVRVSTSKYTTKLVRLSKKSFCEILDKKMGGEVTKA